VSSSEEGGIINWIKKLINQPKVVRKVAAVMQRHWGALRKGATLVTVMVAMAIEDSIGRGSSSVTQRRMKVLVVPVSRISSSSCQYIMFVLSHRLEDA